MRLAVVRLFAAFLLTLAATSAIFAAELTSTVAASPVTGTPAGWSQGMSIDSAQGPPAFNLLSDGELLRRRGRMGIRPHLRRQLVVVA